jgi:hypothetical protein
MRRPTPQRPQEPLDRQTLWGLAGVLAWLALFAVVEYAHDMMVAKREPVTFWSTVYELAAGYVLGFVAALSASIVMQLGRGPVPELMSQGPWMRSLAMVSLLAVLAISLAGLVMHNLGGPTFTYDIAFVIGVCAVVFAVLPLYRRWRG